MKPFLCRNTFITGLVFIFSISSNAQEINAKPIRTWWLAGPDLLSKDTSVVASVPVQEQFFNQDTSIGIIKTEKGKPSNDLVVNSRKLKWTRYNSHSDIIDLDSIYKQANFASAYAFTEIKSGSGRLVYLAAGSDDGIKIWLNGKLVHKNWLPRGIDPDADLVPLKLTKGTNQLLVKVQDMAGGWGFTARFLDEEGLTNMLVKESAAGNLDDAEQLLKAGARINRRGQGMYSPIVAAKLKGREETVKLLLSKGAEDAAPAAPETLLKELYDSLNGKPYPGIAVLIAKDGKIIYKNGFGYANIENKIPVSTTTKFRIGSITKQFVASGILKLQEEGKIQLSDKLSTYFPGFPRGDSVTIHHLLTHTSGIHSYTNDDSFSIRVVKPISNEELLNTFKNVDYDFSPGEKYQYNNSGYFLLGYIIEKISGKSLDAFLKERFFEPLQMTNTGMHSSTIKLENEAKGYQKEGSSYSAALNWDMSWAAGAGALYSTVEDLYKWNEAVFSGKVLNEQNQKLAFTPVKLNNGKKPEVDYGYGWAINTYRGEDVIEHSGGLHGFISQLARYPKEHLTVVMLTNVTPSQLELNPNKLAEFYLWAKLDKQQSYSSSSLGDSMNFSGYVGAYDFEKGAMNITSEGNNLFAQLNDQAKFQIYPIAADEFFWKVVEAKIKFIRNDKGEVISGQFQQGNFNINAPKIKEKTFVKIDSTIIKDYAGKYQFKNNTVITVLVDGNKISVRPNDEAPFELSPLSESEFYIRQLNGNIIFLRDEKGKVDRVSVTLGQDKTIAPRIK